MTPAEIGRRYDALASAWDARMAKSDYGLAWLRRAIRLCTRPETALDVGCGTGGRLIEEMIRAGFEVEGLDVSSGMLEIAARRHPGVRFVQADICTWSPPRSYDLIVAWDSLFHLPCSAHATVVKKLCEALSPGGVLLFTAGGREGEITGEMLGQTLYYGSLADEAYLKVVNEAGCRCLVLERDQYPDEHIVVVTVRTAC